MAAARAFASVSGAGFVVAAGVSSCWFWFVTQIVLLPLLMMLLIPPREEVLRRRGIRMAGHPEARATIIF